VRPSRKSLARQSNKELGPGCLRLFFLPFFLAGAGMLYGFAIRPGLQILASHSWTPTPCVIESSQVGIHSGEDGATYSVDLRYRYVFDDRNHTSTRYRFSSMSSSSGRKAKQAVVDLYPAGSLATCFVNPKAPEEAVIDRSWQWEFLITGGFASVFVLVGGLGILFAGRFVSNKDPAASRPRPAMASSGEPGVLKPHYTPVAKFVGILIGAIVWNGFMSFFIYMVFFSDDKQVPLFAKIIVGILALVGVGLIVGVFYNFLALFNPRIRITAPTTVVPLGGELHLTWTVSGRTGMLRKLRIIFEGREEATYKRGTNTATDTQVFAAIPVFETSEREFLAQGSARVAVPANLMYTFEARSNKVLWRLKVQGEIPRWPDVADEYPITVLPLPLHR
jgi:hypothetical protein